MEGCCFAKRNNLTPEDLWRNPVEAGRLVAEWLAEGPGTAAGTVVRIPPLMSGKGWGRRHATKTCPTSPWPWRLDLPRNHNHIRRELFLARSCDTIR